MSKKIWGYASAANADTLQVQAETLEDAGVLPENIRLEIINGGHKERTTLDKLLTEIKNGDEVVLCGITTLGVDILEAKGNLDRITSIASVRFLTPGKGPWGTQHNAEAAFNEYANEFENRKADEPKSGKPRKPYPVNWREVYNQVINGKMRTHEACEVLGVKQYDFYRMMNRYTETFRDGKK